jgi:hypothetical protein
LHLIGLGCECIWVEDAALEYIIGSGAYSGYEPVADLAIEVRQEKAPAIEEALGTTCL